MSSIAQAFDLPTEEQSQRCDAAYAQYVRNLDGARPGQANDFRAGWMEALRRETDAIQRDAYAEGRDDESEARAPHFLRCLDLLEKAQELAQGIWRDELKKDERDGLAFNLMSGIREFLRDANDA